jgi:hypothetical protein
MVHYTSTFPVKHKLIKCKTNIIQGYLHFLLYRLFLFILFKERVSTTIRAQFVKNIKHLPSSTSHNETIFFFLGREKTGY